MRTWLKQVGTIAAGVFAGLALTAAAGAIILTALTALAIGSLTGSDTTTTVDDLGTTGGGYYSP